MLGIRWDMLANIFFWYHIANYLILDATPHAANEIVFHPAAYDLNRI